jgi:hypothetical protein
MQLDARSLPYMVERTPPELRRPLRSKRWGRALPILDQGQVGACVGFAATGLLGSAPADVLNEALGLMIYTDREIAAAATDYALALYAETTAADPYEGTYPPDDTGTDGLSVCQVLRRRGVISAYRHASTLRGLVELLQDGPVLMGMPWRERFFEPTEDGHIDPEGWADTEEVGGHEVVVEGVSLAREEPANLARAVFIVANSWSASWGPLGGRFLMNGQTYLELRDSIDLRQPMVGIS